MAWRWMVRVASSLAVSPEQIAADPRIATRTLVPEHVHQAAGVRRLAELGPRNTRFVESGELLAAAPRLAVLRDAVEHGVTVVFAECEALDDAEMLVNALPGVAIRLDTGDQPGALIGVNVAGLLRICLERDERSTLAALEGMSTLRAEREVLHIIPAQAAITRVGPIRRMLSDPRVYVYLIVLIYSALRALVVTFIPEFHGSILVLWAIDLITAVPYTWAVLAMIFAPRMRVRILATAVAIVTFTAPYVYFWMHGKHYPPYVAVVIATLTLVSVLSELAKYFQELRLRRLYRRVTARPAALARE